MKEMSEKGQYFAVLLYKYANGNYETAYEILRILEPYGNMKGIRLLGPLHNATKLECIRDSKSRVESALLSYVREKNSPSQEEVYKGVSNERLYKDILLRALKEVVEDANLYEAISRAGYFIPA